MENFYPAYRGGGPIQSVTNLINWLQTKFQIFVVTSAYDLQSKVILDKITPNTWNEVMLPGASSHIMVWYSQNSKFAFYRKLFKEKNPDLIYFNGIFSLRFFMFPLIAVKLLIKTTKIIICPRGMLQRGALANHSLKKKMYLKIVNRSRLTNNAKWHATSMEEKTDILKYFPENNGVYIAYNIPKRPLDQINIIQKQPGQLNLVYLSLITEKKNLLFLLEIIKETENITLDIFGPVKDNAYWNECVRVINEVPEKVRYRGDVVPLKVQDTISNYHGLILLTKGENFGHALYESLSAGRPIITSEFTPWINLQQHNAGWNVKIDSIEDCLKALNQFYLMQQGQYTSLCLSAYTLAKEYFKGLNTASYDEIFS